MLDNTICFLGVAGSMIAGAVMAQAPSMTGWENYGALGILAMTMWIVLTRQTAQLEHLANRNQQLSETLTRQSVHLENLADEIQQLNETLTRQSVTNEEQED